MEKLIGNQAAKGAIGCHNTRTPPVRASSALPTACRPILVDRLVFIVPAVLSDIFTNRVKYLL
jgi:hypothetical protein